MIKKLVLVFITVITISSYGQEGTASPYSFYGIGSLKFKGTVENRSMGGLNVYLDSIHVNLQNPASYAGSNVKAYPFNGESRPVKFTVGGSYSNIDLKTNSGSDNTASTTFDYLALNVPIGKFGFAFGLLPHTSVGYKINTRNTLGNIKNKFSGKGGVNKTFLGFGYQIIKGLNIGADFQYNFGNIQTSTVEFVYDDDGSLVDNQSRESSRYDLSGLSFNLGLSYKKRINKGLELSSGLTFAPESDLVSKNKRTLSTIRVSSSGQEVVNNSVEVDLESQGLLKTDLPMPARVSFGLGLGKPTKWFVGLGAKYDVQEENEIPSSSGIVSYKNASAFSLGGFYIPEYNSFTSYFKRAVYRAGFRFEETGLNINNNSINEFGISFGVGLPVGNFLSNANLGFELGKRGTTESNLIEENFFNFQLSLSLNDRWFQKRKYD